MNYVDIIHGRIEIPDFIESIINTPQFQRLKKVIQLGAYHLIHPEANHTRYEHCIGTYHLANKTIDCLQKNTRNLHIPDFYRKVVGIAALLHDVGHGPFSHSWETVCNEKYHHEEMAKNCIDDIFTEVSIDWMDKEYALNLINALITGDPSCIRDKQYLFLFEIVNNKQCGLDVDKWDYLKRDNVKMKANVPMDFDGVFMNARASDDRAHIEYRYIDYPQIYSIFEARATFHMKFYQQPIFICLDNILKHVIDKADNLEQVEGLNIVDVRSKHTQAFLKLYDEEIRRILGAIQSPSEVVELVKAFQDCSLYEMHPVTKKEQESVPWYLKAEINIPFAGQEMKEGNIIFYGDKADKPKIEKEMGCHRSVSFFQLSSKSPNKD